MPLSDQNRRGNGACPTWLPVCKSPYEPQAFPEIDGRREKRFLCGHHNSRLCGSGASRPAPSITTRQQGGKRVAIRSRPRQNHPGLLLSAAGGGRTGPERLPTVSAAATAVMAPLRGNDCRLLTWHSAHTHERSRKGGTLAARYICRHRIHKQNTGHATGLAGAPVPMDGVSAPPAPRSLPAWFLGRARCWPGGTALNVTGPCRAQSSRRTRHREWREAHRPCGEAPGLCAAVPEPAGHWNTRAACWCCRRSSFLAIRSWLFPGLAQAIV